MPIALSAALRAIVDLARNFGLKSSTAMVWWSATTFLAHARVLLTEHGKRKGQNADAAAAYADELFAAALTRADLPHSPDTGPCRPREPSRWPTDLASGGRITAGGEADAPGVLVDRLRILDGSQQMFERREDGLFKVSGKPDGTTFESGPNLPQVITHSLEGSNVSAIEAMTRLMDHSRSFETQIRIIKETKALDEQSSSMLKNA